MNNKIAKQALIQNTFLTEIRCITFISLQPLLFRIVSIIVLSI